MKDTNFHLRLTGKMQISASLLFILLFAISPAGCTKQNQFSQDVPYNLSAVKSVCLLELQNKTSYPNISTDTTELLYQALQKKQRFTLSMLKQTDPAWNTLEVKPNSAYTLEQLMSARKLLGADALLMGTITSYSPYPRMALGLQLKLVDIRTGQVVWAIEQIWESADKGTQERMKKYFDKQLRSDFSTIGEQLGNLSPINFVKFITYEITETM
jgi:curli biogenesis system outer membrane secretion channel CsgG